MDEKYNLIWNSFQATVATSLDSLRKEGDFFDVTIVSQDQTAVQAHKVILSACSPLLRNILRMNKHQHPLIYLNGIESAYLKMVVDYIYMGEIQVPSKNIYDFLNVADKLQVAGLTNDLLAPQETAQQQQTQLSEPQNQNINDSYQQNVMTLHLSDKFLNNVINLYVLQYA